MSDRPALAPNVKPPLSGRLKASAAGAGILGFLFTSLGWTLVAIAIAFGSLVTLISTAAAQQASSTEGEAAARLLRAIARALNIGAIPLVIVGVVGAILWILGLFISRGILRRGGHHRPWAITWSGLGIAILISLLVSALGGVIAGIVTPILLTGVARSVGQSGTAPDSSAFQPLVTEGIAFGIAYLVLTILIGWLAWSLMARAFRPTAQQLADREQRQAERAATVAHRERVEADAAARGVRPSAVEREEQHATEHPPRHEADPTAKP